MDPRKAEIQRHIGCMARTMALYASPDDAPENVKKHWLTHFNALVEMGYAPGSVMLLASIAAIGMVGKLNNAGLGDFTLDSQSSN